MSHKDYIIIAQAFAATISDLMPPNGDVVARRAVRCAANAVADALASDNPRFDRDRFLTAAGVR